MKTASFPRTLFPAAVIALQSVANVALAQVEEDPVTVPVRISLSASYVGAGGVAGFSVNGYGNSISPNPPQAVNFALSAQLMPAKTYTMTITASNVFYGFGIYVTGPTGYRVYVDEVERYGLVYSGPGHPRHAINGSQPAQSRTFRFDPFAALLRQ